ncbi:hypothetical protein VTK56DRAFT_8016 [Thermocarpiscus australiensis]
MANAGRFVCVLVPFLLTLASLIAMLVAGLAGVTDKSLYMFQVNTTDLSISPLSVASIVSSAGADTPGTSGNSVSGKRQDGSSQTSNITAADLGLDDLYDVSIWGYCYTPQNGSRECTKPAFDWANDVLNGKTGNINSMLTATGQNVTLPKEITDAIDAFSTVSKWTQIVFIIAYVVLGVELLLGIFANCSRVFSCLTWLVAGLAAAAVCSAAGLATATSVVVVGAIDASAKVYGVDASLQTKFLAVVWLGAAFALASAFFWLFTICCCAPDHSSRHRGVRHRDAEKYGTGYQPLSEPSGYPQQYARQWPQQTYGAGAPAHESAYEPFSHARV